MAINKKFRLVTKPKTGAGLFDLMAALFRKTISNGNFVEKMLTDTFINTIHLYDDKIRMIFHFENGAKTIIAGDEKAAPSAAFGSALDCSAVPKKAEQNFFCSAFFIHSL